MLYETAADREREFQILRHVCGRLHLIGLTMPKGWGYDAEIVKYPRVIAVAEVKHRNCPFDHHPDYTVDQAKLLFMAEQARKRNLRVWLLISWLGDVRYARMSILGIPLLKVTEQPPRHDRPSDLPDMVSHVPLKRFVKV
jgi:hypothetical protein